MGAGADLFTHKKTPTLSDHRYAKMKITKREQEIMTLLLQGKTNKQIAQHLKISDFTVRDHVSSILHKHNTSSRSQLFSLLLASPLQS
ncbi:LuxR C-terminal-related transcriptional regulator [Pseudomonas fluorescens]|uniref:LuxR C-terminal-related transcriptional regulator n=1 Tax=Pseudomonas fluorescens TaxID=294 RepID=UPI003F98D59E